MINLLPQEEKKKILTEYRFRLGIVAVFAVAALVLASLVLLAPSYFLAVSKYKSISVELAALESKQGQGVRDKDINTQINTINKKINMFLKGVAVDTTASSTMQVILSILRTKGDAIKIQGVTYDIGTGQGRFVVVGTALNRDGLSQFVESLKKEPTFAKVEIPISSYVKSSDIDFSIVVERGVKK